MGCERTSSLKGVCWVGDYGRSRCGRRGKLSISPVKIGCGCQVDGLAVCRCMHARVVNRSVMRLHELCSPPGSSVHGILQAGILQWVAMPSSQGSSRQGSNYVSCISCMGWRIEPPRKPVVGCMRLQFREHYGLPLGFSNLLTYRAVELL